jgi:hypothetical protein
VLDSAVRLARAAAPDTRTAAPIRGVALADSPVSALARVAQYAALLSLTRPYLRSLLAQVLKAYGGAKKIEWLEVLAGEKAFNKTGQWLPAETLDTFRKQLVGIKGPLTTPVGGGIRSLNVALRQELDLYVCLRPVRWFTGAL